ncbi:MAG: peptidylprolyl isomerase [Patescibacteria group bacterium]
MKMLAISLFVVLSLTACARQDLTSRGGSVEIDNTTEISGVNLDLSEYNQSKTGPSNVELGEYDPKNFEDLLPQYDQARIKTNAGYVEIKFYNQDAPFTVNNFLNLAKLGFYNGTKFHRVIPKFMIQGGDPNSKDDQWDDDGRGGPNYRFKDEINNHKIVRGSLAMANSGADTNGSQFFIVVAESTPWLDGLHTNFGEVVSGMSVVDAISNVETNSQDHPMLDIVIENIELIKSSGQAAVSADSLNVASGDTTASPDVPIE